MGYKVKKIYVGTKQVRPEELVLKKVLDFSTNDLHGFTNTTNAGPGLEINTSGQYCSGIYNYSQTGNGEIWKEINARRFRGRIKFGFYRAVKGYALVGPLRALSTITNPRAGGYSSYHSNVIGLLNTESTLISSVSYTPSLSSQYYLDLKFESGLYTVTIYDINLNKLKEITYQSSDTVCKYSGFTIGGGDSGYGTVRVYEYREAYDNN